MNNRTKLLLAGVGTAIVGLAVVASGSSANVALEEYLQQQLVAWAPPAWEPLDFCLQLTRASYDNPSQPYNTPAVLAAELDFLLSLNPTSIRVDIGYDAFAQDETAIIDALDTVVTDIKSAGVKLVIADGSREYYRTHPQTWAAFQTEWVARVADLAARYQPYAYLVIKEPGWYAPMISDAKTNPLIQQPSSWVSLLGELNGAVKSASPSTLCGISTTGSSVNPSKANASLYSQIMQGAAAMSTNDILGFDIYGSGDFAGAQDWLTANSSGGKQVWVAETWSSASGGAQNPPTIDADWVGVAYDFCLRFGASLMNPFFTDAMCSYSLSGQTNPATIVSDYQRLTMPSYAAYRQLIGGSLPA